MMEEKEREGECAEEEEEHSARRSPSMAHDKDTTRPRQRHEDILVGTILVLEVHDFLVGKSVGGHDEG